MHSERTIARSCTAILGGSFLKAGNYTVLAMILFISCLIWMSIQSYDKNIKLRAVEVHFVLSMVKMLSYTYPVYGHGYSPSNESDSEETKDHTLKKSDVKFQDTITIIATEQPTQNATEQERENRTLMTTNITIHSNITTITAKQERIRNTTEQQGLTEYTAEEQTAVTVQGLTEYTAQEQTAVTVQGLTEYTAQEQTSVTEQGSCNPSDCVCLCHSKDVKEKELEAVVQEIQKHLTVPKTNLSSSLRRKISASDPRTSSKIIGMTLGVSILTLTISAIVISDFIRLLLYVCNSFAKAI